MSFNQRIRAPKLGGRDEIPQTRRLIPQSRKPERLSKFHLAALITMLNCPRSRPFHDGRYQMYVIPTKVGDPETVHCYLQKIKDFAVSSISPNADSAIEASARLPSGSDACDEHDKRGNHPRRERRSPRSRALPVTSKGTDTYWYFFTFF